MATIHTGQAAGMKYLGGDYYGDPGSQRTYDTRTKTYSTNYNWLVGELKKSGQYVGDNGQLTPQQQAAQAEAQRRLGAENFAREQTVRRGRFSRQEQPTERPIGLEALKQAEQKDIAVRSQQPNIRPGSIEAAKQREREFAHVRAATTRGEAIAIAGMLRSPTSSITQEGISKGYALTQQHRLGVRPEDIAPKHTASEEFRRAYPSFAPKALYPRDTIENIGQDVKIQMNAMYPNLGIQPLPKAYGNRYDIYANASIIAGRERVFAGQEGERYREAMRQKEAYAKTYWEKLSPAEKVASGADVFLRNAFTGTAKYAMTGKNIFTPQLVYETHRGYAQKSFLKSVSENQAFIVGSSGLALGGGLGMLSRFTPRVAKAIGYGIGATAALEIGSQAYKGHTEKALSEGLAFAAGAPFAKSGFSMARGGRLPKSKSLFDKPALETVRGIKRISEYNKMVTGKGSGFIKTPETIEQYNLMARESPISLSKKGSFKDVLKAKIGQYKPTSEKTSITMRAETPVQYTRMYGEKQPSLVVSGHKGRLTYSGKNVLSPVSSEAQTNIKKYNKLVGEKLQPGEIRFKGTPTKPLSGEIRSTKTVNLMDMLIVGSPGLRTLGRSVRASPRVKASKTSLKLTSLSRKMKGEGGNQIFIPSSGLINMQKFAQSNTKQISNIAAKEHKNVLRTNTAYRQMRALREDQRQLFGFGQMFAQDQAIAQDQSMKQAQSLKQVQEKIQKQVSRQITREITRTPQRERPPKPPREPPLRFPKPAISQMIRKRLTGKARTRRFTTSLGGKTYKQLQKELRRIRKKRII